MTAEPQMRSNRIWWQLATLLLVSAAAVYVGISFDEQKEKFWPEAQILVSTFNKKPSGLSGLKDIAARVGLTLNLWQLPYRQLDSAHGMLVIIYPSESFSDLEAEQILNWVKKGNDLIYFDHFAYKLTRKVLNKLGIETKEADSVDDLNVPVKSSLPEFSHVKSLTVSSERRLVGGEPLVTDKSGTLISLVKHGQGRILIGTVPAMFCNRKLSDEKNWPNFQFIINWIRTARGDVLIDERCHGFSSATNVFHFLLRGASGLVFLQFLAALAVGIFSAAHRFGTARRVEVKRKISNLEFIYGLSNAFRRARANTAVLEIIGQSFKNNLSRVLGVSPHDPNETIIEAWKISRPDSAINIEKFFADYESALSKKHLSETELKTLVGTCDKIADSLKDHDTSVMRTERLSLK